MADLVGAAAASDRWPMRPSGPPRWPSIEGIDGHDAALRLGDDPALFMSLLRRFLNDIGTFDASDMAVEPADLAARAHKLKGIAGMLGAKRVVQIATRLEAASCKNGIERSRTLQRDLFAELQRLEEAAGPALLEHEAQAKQAMVGELPASLDGREIEALLAELREANLGALDRCARLGPQLRRRLGPVDYAVLQDRIEGFRFSEAAQLIDSNLRSTARVSA